MNAQKSNPKQLYDAILKLKNNYEVQNFLDDLLTPLEIEEFTTRLHIASLLNQGLTYAQIEEQTNISSTTIARISKCLQGPKGGYRLILDRLGDTSQA